LVEVILSFEEPIYITLTEPIYLPLTPTTDTYIFETEERIDDCRKLSRSDSIKDDTLIASDDQKPGKKSHKLSSSSEPNIK